MAFRSLPCKLLFEVDQFYSVAKVYLMKFMKICSYMYIGQIELSLVKNSEWRSALYPVNHCLKSTNFTVLRGAVNNVL